MVPRNDSERNVYCKGSLMTSSFHLSNDYRQILEYITRAGPVYFKDSEEQNVTRISVEIVGRAAEIYDCQVILTWF